MQKTSLKIVFLLFLILGIFRAGLAQVYPVQLSTQLLPPYSSYLPDYGDPTNEKLKCILVLQDFSVTHRDVKLEITIAGNGFTIQTSPQFVPSPITLIPGVPALITGSDLAPYLETQNLNFTGINAADYELRKILPEGQYSICIRAVDYYNSTYTVVSNESCNYAWFFLNDPPYLNFPLCGEEINPVTPQNIIFQWTAMNLNSPNSAFNTEYDFELFELRPNNAIPNNVVQNSAPVFSITTTQPFFQYGITEPTLYLGMNYVWRVRARDLSGRDLFKNDGYSQICTFTYGNINSIFPEDAFLLVLQAQASTHRQGKVWWNQIANFSQYHVQLRKTGTENWFDYYSTLPELKINALEPSTAYEARVMGTGNNVESEWSNTATFTTPPLPQFNCNDQTQPVNALSANPLLTANAGMIFQIGQFEITATSITPDPGAPGYFSGYGKVQIYLVNLGVKYDHVYINDNLEITSGNVVALTEGIDAWLDNWMIDQETDDAHFIEGDVDSIIVNDTSITVITTDGDTLNFNFPDNGHPIIINDESGDQYIVWPDGTITQGSWLDYSSDFLDATAENKIVFSAASDQQYGFDEFIHPEWENYYEVIRLADSTNYFVANKSLKKSGNDFVYAETNLPDLIFVNGNGDVLPSSIEGNKTKITLQNFSESGIVYAKLGELKLGKLNLRVYEEEVKEVVVVAVGNASLPDEISLREEVQKTFRQGVVNVNVSYKPNFNSNSWDLNGDGKLAAGNFNSLQDYSEEMKRLSSDWLEANEINKDAYILFVIPGFDEQNVDKGGYMPLGRHKGFIKSGSESKIYSHELAHGIFGLEHTFPLVEESSTNNLLDYTSGFELNYEQWEKMRWNWSRFDLINDEEENFYNMSFVDEVNPLNEQAASPTPNSCFQFLTKSGKIAYFDSEFRSSVESYLLDNGKLHGVTKMVGGVPKRYMQASAANIVNVNAQKQVTSTQINEALICFECLDEICSQVSEFSGPEVCEVAMGTGINGQPQKIYNRVPSAFLIDLRNYTADCIPGVQVMSGFENGEIVCHTVTESDCDEFGEEGNGFFTGEELVDIELVPEELYGCEREFAWVNLFGKAVQTNGFNALAAGGNIVGFKYNNEEYVACYAGGINSLEQTEFYVYVNKDKFLQKQSDLNSSQLKIRVKDLTDEIKFKESQFAAAPINAEVHYRNLDRFGCYFEYKFTHDGRNEYEFDGYQFNGVQKTIYWRNSCGLAILQEALCGGMVATAEDVAEFLGPNINMATIPDYVYNPSSSSYTNIFYGSYVALNPTVWLASDEAASHQFAFLCGIFNGIINEAEGLVESIPILVQYLCDGNFRQEINAAISEIDLESIKASIAEDFEGNSYQQAEASGRYTIAVVSLVIPFTKINWAGKSAQIISRVKTLPTKAMKFIKKVKARSISGLEVVKGNIQKIIFVNASNAEVELIRFTEEGTMVIDETRLVSQAPANAEELFDLGAVTYKSSEDVADQTGSLKVVRGDDGEVWVVAEITELNWIDELASVLPTGAKAKITGWIDEGLDPNKISDAFNLASDKISLYNNLSSAKSIYHQRVYIKDWDAIPGVSRTNYSNNSLPENEISASLFGEVNTQYNLPAYRAGTFSENVELIQLNEGTTIYRVTDAGGEGGTFWTLNPPESLSEVIGGTAVLPEWNGYSKIVQYTVPSGGMKVWKGKAAAQPISLNPNLQSSTVSLPGNETQIFINDFLRNQNFKNAIIDVTSIYKNW